MDTLNNIAYNIAESVDKAHDYSVIERIKKLIIYYRALFIRRTAERNNFLSSHFKQNFISETVKLRDAYTEEEYVRTKLEIPTTIRLKETESFTYVGGINKTTPYNEITPRAASLVKFDKFSNRMVRFYYHDNYLWILNSYPEKILIEGIFEDPTLIPGFDANGLFPISDDMISLIITTIVTTEFKIDQSQNNEI